MRGFWAIIFTVLALLSPPPLAAGPWARAEGEVFLAPSVERARDGSNYASLYGEYGLGPARTIGLEIGHSDEESRGKLWWEQAFTRGADRFSLSLGLGALRREGELIPLASSGLAWGRPLEAMPVLRALPGDGWFASEAEMTVTAEPPPASAVATQSAVLPYLTPKFSGKLQVTLGWRATERIDWINQIRLEERDDSGFSSKWATSVVYDLPGPGKPELGLVLPVKGQGEVAVKLGSWFQF